MTFLELAIRDYADYLSAGMRIACRFPGEADGIAGECVRLAFPTSTHRLRPGRPLSPRCA